jgi:hypothetical protein
MVTVAADQRRPADGHAGEHSSTHRADKTTAGIGARLTAAMKALLELIPEPIGIDSTWSSTASEEQFQALTRRQQDRLLNSGYRPYSMHPSSR